MVYFLLDLSLMLPLKLSLLIIFASIGSSSLLLYLIAFSIVITLPTVLIVGKIINKWGAVQKTIQFKIKTGLKNYAKRRRATSFAIAKLQKIKNLIVYQKLYRIMGAPILLSLTESKVVNQHPNVFQGLIRQILHKIHN